MTEAGRPEGPPGSGPAGEGRPAGPPGSGDATATLLSGFHRVERRIHRRALALLHMNPAEREEQVHLMLANRQRGVVEYWTFLVLSMAIATLGLAMDSTTVVIGAMLVSPLMGPIVEFAMGLVVGSPVLTVRSVLRILGSVVVVVAGAMIMTLILPFHEVTSEIAARTEPTLMDLALAGFVALAAALTAVKAKSETNIVAAGAAVGIALIPPVCVVGFGLGVMDARIAGGASLLLVTNFTAIIFVGAIFFYLLGFEEVSVQEWDQEALAEAPPGSYTRRVLLGADRIFGNRRSRLFRVLVPGLVFGLLAVPLHRALDRVSWEVQTRSAVRRILAELPTGYDYVQTSQSISYGQVGVRTYVVGASVGAADSLSSRLSTRIAAATGVEPDVRVTPVPNFGALRSAVGQTSGTPPERRPEVELAGLRQDLAAALERAWPLEAYGPLVGWHVQLSDAGDVALHVRHVGPAPDAGATSLLAHALGPDAPEGMRVRFDPLDTTGIRAPPGEAVTWLPALARTVETARTTPGIHVCVEIPDPATLRAAPASTRAVADAVPRLLEGLPADRYALRPSGSDFGVRLRPAATMGPAATAGDTGAVPVPAGTGETGGGGDAGGGDAGAEGAPEEAAGAAGAAGGGGAVAASLGSSACSDPTDAADGRAPAESG